MKNKLKLIWRILTSEYFVLLTWDEKVDTVDIKGVYKKEHKEMSPIVNDVVETVWKHLYFNQDEER